MFRIIRVALIAVMLYWPCAAHADELPKSWTVDMTTVMTDQDGAPIKDQFARTAEDPDCAKCKSLTLGEACAHALFYVGPDEKDVTAEQKWAWATFAERIRNDPKATLTAAEGDLIYRRLGKIFSGIVLMRAMPLIDPNRHPPEIK